MPDPVVKLTLADARYAWLARQCLARDGISPGRSPGATLAETVGAVGWVPVPPASASPYLALRARGALVRRAELDEATFVRGELTVVPGPRGGTWLVPTADAPLARAFAVADHASREARVASACALNAHELRAAREALCAALESPVSPEALRAGLSPAVLRPLGDVGRRAGSATLAGLVLRSMWILGEVLRVPVEPRVDCNRWRYVLDGRPRVVPTAADAVDVIAARWFSAHAPTTARAFAATFGIATGRALAALKPLRTVTVEIDELGAGFLSPADDTILPRDPDAPPEVTLLPWHDPLLDAHPTLAGLCPVAVARAAVTRTQGPAAAVLVNGEVVGLWTWDTGTHRVTWRALRPDLSPAVITVIDAEAMALGHFIAAEIPVDTLGFGAPPRRPVTPTGETGMEL